MTDTVLTVVLALLAVNVLLSLVRVVRGPTGRDRLLGVVLSGTTGAAVLLVAATLTGTTALRDTALVVVALATVVVLARVRGDARARGAPEDGS